MAPSNINSARARNGVFPCKRRTKQRVYRTKTLFKKRMSTIMKKAKELEILCDVRCTVVCFDSTGKLTTYPEDHRVVAERVMEYTALPDSYKVMEKLDNLLLNYISSLSGVDLNIAYEIIESKIMNTEQRLTEMMASEINTLMEV